MFQKIVAVGDCNTLGAKHLEYNSYPEIVADRLGAQIINLGHTMATSREGVHLLSNQLAGAECVVIQFGLVDSYKTFKYAPYVLYYPDNIIRKQLRSFTKKYKKICKKIGLNRRIGETNVVQLDEYECNMRKMIEMALPRMILLLDTIPNLQLHRNQEIQRYNKCLDRICQDYQQCIKVDLYDVFLNNLDTFYMDATHANETGYAYIAGRLQQTLNEASSDNL